MIIKVTRRFFCGIVVFLIPFAVPGQIITDPVLKSYLKSITETRKKLPVEKLYLQFDKPYYTLGDTLHFKSYLLNADYLKPSETSGLLYVELDNMNNKSVKRIMVPVVFGVSWGGIALDEKDIPGGSYTLRAYTNWMQNFGEDYIFKKSIYISSTNSASTLVKADFKLDSTAGKTKVQAMLRFTNLDKAPMVLKDMKLVVMNGTHTQARDNVSTGLDGTMAFNLGLNDKTLIKNLTIQAQQRGKGADTTVLAIPIILNRPEKTDLQFMPEGGNLVAGIETKIGFKAISEDGKGATVNGTVFNSKQQPITSFQSVHSGMGSFELTPGAGESYYAKIAFKNGITKNYPLPAVSPTGVVLRIEPKANDSLELILNVTPNLISNTTYHLIGQARGVVCYASAFSFDHAGMKITLPKILFPTGITRFTLLNSNSQPLNERLVYINHGDNLKITIVPNKKSYANRDSIALTLQINDKTGKPVKGTFSLAVTDDSQVKTDKDESNFINNMLFTSDLKGNIENPGYYFENNSLEGEKELDNLLLTQGWVGYSWKNVFDVKKPQPKYLAEKEFTIDGKVVNIFNKPVKKAAITLLRKYPFMVTDTVTDNEGRFSFKGNDYLPTDSAFFFISSKNKNGNNFNVGIEVNEFNPPEFAPLTERQLPWYVNSDTVLLNNNHTKAAQLQAESNYRGEGHQLKEVVINQKKLIRGSQNPMPELDDVIWDEKDMAAAKKMTLFEILEYKYKTIMKLGNFNFPAYILNGHYRVRLIIDGYPGAPTVYYMNYLTAEDIRGVEIRYVINPLSRFDMAIIFVTTFSGNGKFIKHAPGTYAYKPIPFTTPIQYYKPRYTVKNKGIAFGTDLRSTIDWEPNIVTDKDGRAVVSFFSADKPATYTIIAEGTDLQGNIGTQQSEINIRTKDQEPGTKIQEPRFKSQEPRN